MERPEETELARSLLAGEAHAFERFVDQFPHQSVPLQLADVRQSGGR
jgi:hypothetical protein